MPTSNENRLKLEMTIVRAYVKAILAAGHFVTVNDGGEDTVIKSRKLNEIVKAMRTTDEDVLKLTNDAGHATGWLYFVYGNEPHEVLNDHTVNLSSILDPVTDKYD